MNSSSIWHITIITKVHYGMMCHSISTRKNEMEIAVSLQRERNTNDAREFGHRIELGSRLPIR